MAKDRRGTRLGVGAAALILAGTGGPALAGAAGGKTCFAVAAAQLEACRSEVKADSAIARAVCLNEPDAAAREACFDAAKEERQDAGEECREQRSARRDLCEELGGGPYAPSFDPADFDDDFASPAHPNPWFPVRVGHTWTYAGGDETIEIEVLGETKQIEGVPCVVVRDRALVAGAVVEDTDDWFGLRLDGTVDYCGEISQTLELFPGDAPAEPELVTLEGSWKAGREGALPGTLFPGAPAVGQVYRQEFAPGVAEDAARVLSTTYAFGSDTELDQLVPEALAASLCAAADCVVTAEFTPIDPGGLERKYYAAGIGLFLEVDPEGGDVVQLVDCNVDPRCASLPQP
jgi:hypothetical protein